MVVKHHQRPNSKKIIYRNQEALNEGGTNDQVEDGDLEEDTSKQVTALGTVITKKQQ